MCWFLRSPDLIDGWSSKENVVEGGGKKEERIGNKNLSVQGQHNKFASLSHRQACQAGQGSKRKTSVQYSTVQYSTLLCSTVLCLHLLGNTCAELVLVFSVRITYSIIEDKKHRVYFWLLLLTQGVEILFSFRTVQYSDSMVSASPIFRFFRSSLAAPRYIDDLVIASCYALASGQIALSPNHSTTSDGEIIHGLFRLEREGNHNACLG